MSEEQTDEDLKKLYEQVKHRATAFGLVCGFNNIVAFDFDWPWVYKLWAREFGDRAKTLTIKTPNGGFRPLYYSSDVRSFDGFKNSLHAEVKGRGKYAVLYGKALREDGSQGSYEAVLDLPVKRDDLIVEDSIKWFKQLLERWDFLRFNCVKAQLKTKTISPDHNLRLILADFMMFSGIPIEEAKLFFESCPDYRESITEYQLRYTASRIQQGLKPPSCGKIREMLGWSKDACRGCSRRVEGVDGESEKAGGKPLKRHRHALVVDGVLYETVLDERGFPRFLGFKDGQWVLLDHLETEDESGRRVDIYPASTVEQPYRPYRLYEGWNIVRCPAEVYGLVRGFIRRRVDAPEHYIDLMALDVCLTYFQEKVNTLHYLYFVGDNESGKTRALQVMAMLAYRAFFATDVSAANLIEFLGDENDGLIKGSIFEDEAEDLVLDPDKRRLYKQGYKNGAKVPRVLIDKEHGRRRQRFYNAYCFKAVASEELPSGKYSKGLLERFVILHMLKGDPEKDDLDDEDYDEADRIRLELLKTRLIHYNSKLPEPELKVPLKISEKAVEEKLKGRSRELFGSLLKTAAFFQALDVAREVVGKILTEKVSSRLDSLEGIICRALSNLIKPGELKDDGKVEVEFDELFQKIAEEVDGEIEDRDGKRRILSNDLDFEITPQLLGRKLTDSFQASRDLKREKETRIRIRRFNKKVLRAMFKKYYIQRSDLENNVHNFEKQPSFDKIHGTDRTDLTDISSRESSTLNAVPINGGVQGDTPKDGKIHSLESLEEFKAEKKKPSKQREIGSIDLSVPDAFENKKEILQYPSISEKSHITSQFDIKSCEDIKSTIPEGSGEVKPSVVIVGEPAFDGNCELCGSRGGEVVFRFGGSSRQYYAHNRCLEDGEMLECFYRLVEKAGKTASVETRLDLDGRIESARRIYFNLLEPEIGMVEEDAFIKALASIDDKPEDLLDHLRKWGMIFSPREGWIRWIK